MNETESERVSARSGGKYDKDVFEAQIRHLYGQLPRLLAYSTLVSLLLAVMLRNAVPASHSMAWLGMMLFVIFARLLLYRRYTVGAKSRPVDAWARWYVAFSGISGLVWGMAGVLLFAPDRLELQSLILLVLAGMGAGSASVLPMYLPAFYAYLPSSMIPAGVMMFLQGGQFHVFMGIFDFVFLFGVLAFGRAIGRAFETSLQLRFENKDLVSRLEAQKEELMIANLAKSKFLAAASHDLRQPLHALSLFSEILQKEARDRQTRSIAQSIHLSVGVLERLFSALLDISRIDAGVLKPEIETFKLNDVIGRVYADCLPMAHEKNLRLRVESQTIWTQTDPTLLERILRNLVVNGIRYTPAGEVVIRCTLSGGEARLSVQDTGLGIPEDRREDIFEEFTQLGNPERDRSKGLGLGLSIVRRLAHLLNHPLELKSGEGHGSEFTLTLPAVVKPASSGEVIPEDYRDWTGNLGLRVLVIDDDADILTATDRLLSSWGCRVFTALNADQAQELSRNSDPFDALVTDFRLPGNARGTQVVEAVREIQRKAIPALLITGDTEPARLQEARQAGLELLHKPVPPARLRAWLQKLSLRA